MTEPSPQMSEPYDWEEHHRLRRQLEWLDGADQRLSKNLIDREMIIKLVLEGPIESPESISDVRKIDINRLVEFMPTRLTIMSTLMQTQRQVSLDRSHTLHAMVESLLHSFPEEKFRYPLFRMTESAQAQLVNLEQGFDVIRPIIQEQYRSHFDIGQFSPVKENLVQLRNTFRDTAGYDDVLAVPMQNRLRSSNALYHNFSRFCLIHAGVEAKLAKQCLSVVTTAQVLRNVFNVPSSLPTETFKGIGTFMMIAAMVDLEYAESLRDTVYVMKQAGKPIFPAGPFLTKVP
jgi:hypothetical protein